MPKNKTTKTNNPADVPDVGPNEFTVILDKEEMIQLVQLMHFTKTWFAEVSLNLQKEGNMIEADTMATRSVVSQLLFTKFKDLMLIGEPDSRQVH